MDQNPHYIITQSAVPLSNMEHFSVFQLTVLVSRPVTPPHYQQCPAAVFSAKKSQINLLFTTCPALNDTKFKDYLVDIRTVALST